MKKKFISVIFSIIMLFVLVGCDGNIMIIESTTDEGYLLTAQISYSAEEERVLNNALGYEKIYIDENSPAEVAKSKGQSWKISDYITSVVIYGLSMDFSLLRENNIKFSLVENIKDTSTKITYQIYEALIPFDVLSEAASANDSSDAEKDYTFESGFYINKYHFDMKSPVNGARENYDSASTYVSRIIKNGAYKNASGLIYIPEGGAANENDKLFIPKMEDAFPLINVYNVNDLGLIYGIQNANTLRNTDAVVQVDEYGNTFYFFEDKFTSGEKRISYDIWRANALGFNITALIVAGVAIILMFVMAKYVKPKRRTPVIYIPFDPKKIDPFDSGKVDPFDGYGGKNENKSNKPDPFDGY